MTNFTYMNKFLAILLLLSAALVALSACTPAAYETAPVTVETQHGQVTCQLYTKEIVQWDRPVDWPAGMSVKQAFNVCQIEGIREQKGRQ